MSGPASEPWAGRLLGVSLYIKIVVAATLLIGGAAAAGALVAHAAPGPWMKGWLAAGVLGVAGANALLVHLALRPLRSMARVVREVEEGNPSVRVPVSALADRDMVRMVQTVNRMLDAMDRARNRERTLAARVAEAEEMERKRLAHELLDGTAQHLSSVLLHLKMAGRTGDSANHLEPARTEVLEALEEIGRVARGLRPPELDELGPTRALEVQARQLTGSTGVRVARSGDAVDPHLDPPGALALYRVMREGLANAVEHAEAGQVSLRTRLLPDRVVAELEDDGRGFDPAEAAVAPDRFLGILRMHERARHAGGRLEIRSHPGAGTLVRLELPRRTAGVPS
jgi:signal transduction histidine kinase